MDAFKTDKNRLTVALDALHPNDNSEYVNFGCEYSYYEWAFIRLGWQALFLDDDERGSVFGNGGEGGNDVIPSNIGLGFNYAITSRLKIKLDYAYADFGRLQNTQRFSIGIEF